MRLSEILVGVQDPDAGQRRNIAGIALRQQAVRSGYCFFAIPGTMQAVRRFIPDAAPIGCGRVVTESEGRKLAVLPGVVTVLVPHARRALSRASSLFYGEPSKSLAVVGVTGTKGKTTTCHMVKSVLDACGEKTGLIGTIHNIVGDAERPVTRTTPESTDLHSLMREMVDLGSTAATMEVSSHALALGRVEDLRFRAAVLTNVGRDHLDFHGTVENYAGAKRRLFEMLPEGGVAVLNRDEPMYEFFREAVRVPLVTYGLAGGAEVTAGGLRMDGNGSEFDLRAGGRSEKVRLGLPGRFNIYNALAAAAAAYGMGKDLAAIARGLSGRRALPQG